ncbi:MAG: ABC transporter permease, partial [Chloroflexi bacterium]|nr:ABC transporter permease [Chloroflexota bacterium]
IFIAPINQIDADIDAALVDELRRLDGVERAVIVRYVDVLAPDYSDLPPVNLVAPDGDVTSRPRKFDWYDSPYDEYWDALAAGDVIVSEPFAFRRDITRDNNTITLLTDRGPQPFTVAGVYYDYTTDQGAVFMHHATYRAFYDDPFVSAIALDVEPGVEVDAMLDRLQTGPLAGTGLDAQSNRDLRQTAIEVFDRTFAITVALRLLATVVAFIGILSALLSLQLEHTRQYGIMRANGMTPGQLRRFTFVQTGLMGSAAGLLALPVGVVLAVILVYVINVRSFGWTMDISLRPLEFLQAFAVALVAAVAAGVYPAWKLSNLMAAEALRSE